MHHFSFVFPFTVDTLTGHDGLYGTGNDGTGSTWTSTGGTQTTYLGPGGGIVEHAGTAAYQGVGGGHGDAAGSAYGTGGLGGGPSGMAVAGSDGALHVDSSVAPDDSGSIAGTVAGFHGTGGHGLMSEVINSVGHSLGGHGFHHSGLGAASGSVSTYGGGHHGAGTDLHGGTDDLGPVGASVSYGPVDSYGGMSPDGHPLSHGSGLHGSHGGHGPYGPYGGHGPDGGHGPYGGHGVDGPYGGHGPGSDLINRIADLMGHKGVDGIEELSHLIESTNNGFGSNYGGHNRANGHGIGGTDTHGGYGGDSDIHHLAEVLGSHHVGLGPDVLGRLATVVGHGNVHDGAAILSQLVESSGHGINSGHGIDGFGGHGADGFGGHGADGFGGHGADGFGGHGPGGDDGHNGPAWWSLKNFLDALNHGESLVSLIRNGLNGDGALGGHGNHWVGFPGFPVSLFGGHNGGDEAHHIPGTPFEITMDGKVRLSGQHGGELGGWQDMNHPYSDYQSDGNRWGGMTMVLNGEHGKGPYLLDHWGNAVNLADGHHQGYVMTGHDGHKYLFVPTSAVTGHHADSDDFHNGGWHDGHQTVLTPAGLMDLSPASHWSPTADGEHGPVIHTPSGDMTLGPHGPEVLDSPLGPLRLMPSHDGVMHLESPEVCSFY